MSDEAASKPGRESMKVIGHRLRHPLARIIELCGLIEAGIAGEVSPAILADIQHIQEQAAQALQNVDEVVNLFAAVQQSLDLKE